MIRLVRRCVVASSLLLAMVISSAGSGTPCCCVPIPTNLDEAQRLKGWQLEELFRQAEMGRPLVGTANGRLVHLTDKRLPRLKCRLANSLWRGKKANECGDFMNRWIGNRDWIGSRYVIGPSWIDGKPAVVMEYAPKTPLFENMHDELREVSPGLYIGPVFERFPCPHLRGWIALQLDCCDGKRRKR